MALSGLAKSRGRLRPVVHMLAGFVACVAVAGSGAAQNAPAANVDARLVAPVTEGRGPHEKVVRFEMAPNADDFFVPQGNIDALAGALEAGNRAVRDAAQIDLGIKAFGLTQGAFAAMGTLAEHAAYLKSFSRVNTALNNIGLAVALVQVTRDISDGNTEAAVIGATKAFVNYAVGKWGSSALQIAGVATFIVDVTLSEWQAGLTDIAKDVQYCRYKAYYAAHGMSVRDWQEKALALYKEAERQKDITAFDTWLDAAVNEYVHRAFDSGSLEFYSECGGSSFGDTAYIQRLIEAEHKGLINEMLVEKVLPEIAEYAWHRTVQREVARANLYLRPTLNQTYRLEVTAYGAGDGARVIMPLPNGGEWGGKLRPDGTFRAEITYFALMKAGFPEEIRLETAEGEQEKELIIADGRMTAVFGMPATPFVARYGLEEGAQECEVKRMRDGEPAEFESQTRAASGLDHLDLAGVGDPSAGGILYLGSFDGRTWKVASPGRYVGTASLFGPPYFDNITSLENCSLDMFSSGRLAEGSCTIERFEEKQVSARTVIARTCRSSATIELIGIYAAMGSDMQYLDLTTPEGRAAIEALRAAMGEYMPGFDPSNLHMGAPSGP